MLSIKPIKAADDYLPWAILGVVGYVVYKTTFIPAWNLNFYGDDYVFLNWASGLDVHSWLREFLYSELYNLTYRPLVRVVYLIYLTDDARLSFLLLASMHAFNAFLAFLFYRRLTNIAVAGVAALFFAASFIYYDATHAVYNLATQFSAAFFLTAVLCFMASLKPFSRSRAPAMCAYVLYGLSILTYEITFFGFAVMFALAVQASYGADSSLHSTKEALISAAKRSWIFGSISAIYFLANLVNPNKALHLREHSSPVDLSAVPEILARASHILKNCLMWIFAVERSDALIAYLSVDSVFFFFILVALVTWLARAAKNTSPNSHVNPLLRLVTLACLGMFWFFAFLLPGALSVYFDYRLLYLAYVGFALALACALFALPLLGSVLASVFNWSPVLLAIIAASWIVSNMSLIERMNQNLTAAVKTEQRILASIQPYLGSIPDKAVIAVSYEHNPLKTLPYSYQASPFNEDHGFENALRYYFGKAVAGASVFFSPQEKSFIIGRFRFNQVEYTYDRLVLFDYAHNKLSPRNFIDISDKRISLLLLQRLR